NPPPHAGQLPDHADLTGRPGRRPPLLQRGRRSHPRPALQRDGPDAGGRVVDHLHARDRGRRAAEAGGIAACHHAVRALPGPRPILARRPRRRAAAHRGDLLPADRPGRALRGGGRPLLGAPRPLRVTLWGTRGSLATPGPETVAYGGNTACVEARGKDGTVL